MSSPSPRPASRYRRRILGIGALATFGLYVIGAPVFNNRIEDDLEQRVPEELAEAGFDGVAARFSGQDGTLECTQPLDDPQTALAVAYEVWGVRAVELDRSCRVNRAPTVAATTMVPTTTMAPTDSGLATTGATVAATTTTTVPPDFGTVADIVAADPQFALLSVLVEESGLGPTLAETGADPVTLFAPTDGAFDDVAADVIAQLRADPELLGRVLSHHVVAGRLGSAEFAEGPLQTLAGGSLELSVVGEMFWIDAAAIVDPDIAAGNGVVHAIDRVLVPADLDLTPPEALAPATVTFADGAVTLAGVVASEVERAMLLSAVGDTPVTDLLEVDPDVGLDAATTASLGELVGAMLVNLVSGTTGFDGESLYVQGVSLGDGERDALLVVADANGATADIEPRPEATEDDAVDLEAELNAFVAENPILFEPSSAVLSSSAFAIIDRLALEAQQFTGVAITVEGHTDSDGIPIENVILSQQRADAVRNALVERGLEASSITAEGFGSERPVLVGGSEDKDASRRVEFRVVAT